jgi:hypothetical protein
LILVGDVLLCDALINDCFVGGQARSDDFQFGGHHISVRIKHLGLSFGFVGDKLSERGREAKKGNNDDECAHK